VASKYIETKAGVCGGKPVFAGTRIPVHIVLDMLRAGDTNAEIVRQYPDLTEHHIRAAIGFAADLTRYGEEVFKVPA